MLAAAISRLGLLNTLFQCWVKLGQPGTLASEWMNTSYLRKTIKFIIKYCTVQLYTQLSTIIYTIMYTIMYNYTHNYIRQQTIVHG